MKTKDNSAYLFLGVLILFAVIAALPYLVGTAGPSGALTYAKQKGATCTDTDFGKDYTTAGAAEGLKDWCESKEVLIEYYCTPYGNTARERHICTGDYTCSNGACTIGADVCYDSDGGRFYFKKGDVTVGGVSHTDYCVDYDTVAEFYCTPVNEVGEAAQNCAFGCADGACIHSS